MPMPRILYCYHLDVPCVGSKSESKKQKMSSYFAFLFLNKYLKLPSILISLEFKDQHIMWIESVKPAIDSYIKRSISMDEYSKSDLYQSVRHEMRGALNSLLKVNSISV